MPTNETNRITEVKNVQLSARDNVENIENQKVNRNAIDSFRLQGRDSNINNSNRSCNGVNANISFIGTAGGQSRWSQEGCSSHTHHQTSGTEENGKTTRQYLASTFTISYTMFLIIFGLLSFISSALTNRSFYAELFMIYLMIVASIFISYLIIDTGRHIKTIKKFTKEESQSWRRNSIEAIEIDSSVGPTELRFSQSQSRLNSISQNVPQILHKYCFVRGRHGEFLYLKFGAIWFCFGLLIHSSLILMYEFYYLISEEEDVNKCGSLLSISFEIIFPLYAVFTLFFIYKYINLVINFNQKYARFMLMHLIATSISFLVYQIVCETKEAVILADAKDRELQGITTSRLLYLPSHCIGPDSLKNFYRNLSPYLYPFIIEFFVLSAGVWAIIFLNINKCPKKGLHKGISLTKKKNSITSMESSSSLELSEITTEAYDHDTHVRTNIEIHVDCHRSNRGLFFGLILIVSTICFIILFFVTTSEKNNLLFGLTLDRTFELINLVIMIMAVIGAYIKTTKLDVNFEHISKLDDILLFLSLPAFFVYAVLSIIPAIHYGLIINICNILALLVQVLIQTPFIIDGLRRCSNAGNLQKKKPGREFITFLMIANVSLWIYYTFSVKIDETGDERYEFYGYTLWSILYHVSLPLMMFYRFHSSVCLADIWKHAYKPSGNKI